MRAGLGSRDEDGAREDDVNGEDEDESPGPELWARFRGEVRVNGAGPVDTLTAVVAGPAEGPGNRREGP